MHRLLAVAALGALAVLVLGLVVVGAGVSGSASSAASATAAVWEAVDDSMCASVASGPIGGLSLGQTANAETILSVADSISGENARAAEIALMTALTESDLTNDPGGLGGALGLFQQTPADGWGSPAELLDPVFAAGTFVRHLLAVRGWQHMPPWVAAQEVQRSGAGEAGSPLNPLPGVVGGNYKVHWPDAVRLYRLVTSSWTKAGCGAGEPGGLVGTPTGHGLPAGYRVPVGTTAQARIVIAFALAQLGKRYEWGAAGPSSFDCSGLTMAAWGRAGVRLAHFTVTQEREGRPVPAGRVAPGDLVFVPGSDPPGPGLPGHVGIYLGDGLVVSAIDQQQGVAVQPWSAFVAGGLNAVVDPSTR